MADTNLTPFGRHQLVKRLAAGGMGELFLALGPNDAPCVVKRMLAQHLDKPDFVRMFLAEARLLQRLRHQNIVDVYEVGEVDGQPFFVMELVRGRSLRDLIDELSLSGKALPARHVAEIGLQLLHALEHSHRAVDEDGRDMSIVHRDINPHNVLIGWDGVVKLIDFGIAKSDVSGLHTAVGTIKGKFAYMSPEQSAADPLDARSDLFSAGIVLYEALTLDNPFARPNVVLALEAIQLHPVSPPSSMRTDATALDDVLMRALEKNPDLRFPSAAAFADALTMSVDRLPESPGPLSALMRVVFAADIRAEARHFEGLGVASPIDDEATDPGRPALAPSDISSAASEPEARPASTGPEPALVQAGATLPGAAPRAAKTFPAAPAAYEPSARRVPTVIRSRADRTDRAARAAPNNLGRSASHGGKLAADASPPASFVGSDPSNPPLKRRPWIGYGLLLFVTTLCSFGVTRAVMTSGAPPGAASPLGTIRITAEPRVWVRLGGSAWHRSPTEAQLVEPRGELELRSDGKARGRMSFQIEGGRLQLQPQTRALTVGSPRSPGGPRSFALDGPDAITGGLEWTPIPPGN